MFFLRQSFLGHINKISTNSIKEKYFLFLFITKDGKQYQKDSE